MTAEQRILSSTVGSEPLRKFSALLRFSTGYKSATLNHYDPIFTVLTIELLQFYYSRNQVEAIVGRRFAETWRHRQSRPVNGNTDRSSFLFRRASAASSMCPGCR